MPNRSLGPRANPLGHVVLGLCLLQPACGEDVPAEPVTCEEECQDEIAARALRETLKLIYNLTLQGNPVGPQDESTPCPHGGSARVAGVATSVAEQGTTELELGYLLNACAYQHRDDDAEESYDVVISGSVGQKGILAVQPTATTALIFVADSVSLEGEVFDPPIPYTAHACRLRLAQNGSHLSGTWCEREIGFDL